MKKKRLQCLTLTCCGEFQALNDPSSILLSASAAKAYFGNDDPLNKMLKIDENPPVKVTGVYQGLSA